MSVREVDIFFTPFSNYSWQFYKNIDFEVWPIVYLLSTSQLAMHKYSSIVTYAFDFLSIS